MNALQQFIAKLEYAPYLKDKDMPALIALDRLCPCLVRCGNGRFTCGAQDVPHFVRCVEAGGDYVRDVSFAGEYLKAAERWQPEPKIPSVREDRRTGQFVPQINGKDTSPTSFDEERAFQIAKWQACQHFNEADCGGVFDGNQVTSDADPGL